MPRICVLLAAYNGFDFLKYQIDSILNQVDVDVTLFISLDLSSDDSLIILTHYSDSFDNVFLLPYGHFFGGAASNFYRLISDVDLNPFEYVAFADQDDIWYESKLFNAVNVLKIRNVDGYSGDVTAFWPNGRQIPIMKSQPQCRFDYIFESAGPGCTFVFSKELAISFRHFLKKNTDASKFVLHDWLLYAFARSSGFKWFIDSDSYMLYRQHDNNQIGANDSLSSFLNRFKLVLNGSVSLYINQLLHLLGDYAIDEIPQTMDFKAYIFFIFNWRQLRRRPRDRYLVLVSLFIMLISFYPSKLKKMLF